MPKKKGKLLIGHGSTDVYVAEEVLGRKKFEEILDRDAYLSGVIQQGALCTIPTGRKAGHSDSEPGGGRTAAPHHVRAVARISTATRSLSKGRTPWISRETPRSWWPIPKAGPSAGRSGRLWARGIRLIVPVGLEKLVPSVRKSVELCGQQNLDYCEGLKVGMIPLTGGKVITEIEAIKILAGAEAFHGRVRG